jgi:hypothetical protein
MEGGRKECERNECERKECERKGRERKDADGGRKEESRIIEEDSF